MTESKVKEAGKKLAKGKDYIVKDGDILHFKCGQVKSKKKK